MFPDEVLSRSYSAGSFDREISTGVFHYLAVIVTGLATKNAGDSSHVEQAAREILAGCMLDATRRKSNGQTVEVIEEVSADFFRRRSNHLGGYSAPTDGALFLVGAHNLNEPKASLSLSADWSDVDVTTITDTNGAEAVDASGAQVMVLRSQSFEGYPLQQGQHLDGGTVEIPQYKGVPILKNPYEVPNELDGSPREMFFVGDHADYNKARLDVNGERKDVPGEFTSLISAARYRHENEDRAPLYQLFDAGAGYAERLASELTVYADSGKIVQTGTVVI